MNEKNSFVYFKKISEQTYFDCFKKKFVSEEPNSILQDLSIPEIISLRQYTGKNRVNIIITLTTTCDLKCSYCFENGIIRESSTTSSLEKIVNAIDIFIFENSSFFCDDLNIPASVSGRFQSCHGTGHRSL